MTLGCVKFPVFGEGSRAACGIATQRTLPVGPTMDDVVTVHTYWVMVYNKYNTLWPSILIIHSIHGHW